MHKLELCLKIYPPAQPTNPPFQSSKINMDFYAVLEILPADHQTALPETRYELSDLDQEITAVHNLLALTYKLPSDFDKPAFLKHVQAGLSHTLSQIPITAGALHRDTETNRFYIRRQNDSTVKLGIRYMEEDESFPSYQTMKDEKFPSGIVTGNRLKLFCEGSEPSKLPMGLRIENGCPLSYFQVNFIRGGLILATAMHHLCADGGSLDGFTVAWAASTKAAAQGSAMPTFNASIDRTYFNTTKPDAEELEAVKQRVKGHKLVEIQPPAASTQSMPPKQPPQIGDQIFHIRKSLLDKLKQECKPTESGAFVSTFDCITACIWQAVTRARIPFHNWDVATTNTSVLTALSVRGKFPAVGLDYFGNAITSALTDPMTVAQLIEPGSLSQAAQTIRQCITAVKEDTLPDILKLREGLKSTHKVRPNANFFFGTDIAVTSLTNIQTFKKYDYGFGLPQAFTTPSWPADGVVALYPTCPWRSVDEGVEVQITLEKSCLERMKKDEEFLKFFEVR
jgi:hypothetical protein